MSGILITDLSCKLLQSICKQQIPFYFLYGKAAQQLLRPEPTLPSIGSVVGLVRGEAKARNIWKGPHPTHLILPDSGCGKADRWNYFLCFCNGETETQRGEASCPRPVKWQSRDSHPVSWLSSKLLVPYQKASCASPRDPWNPVLIQAHRASSSPELNAAGNLSLLHPTAKPDYFVKDILFIVQVIEGNQNSYFTGDHTEHSLLFHRYQKEQVRFW